MFSFLKKDPIKALQKQYADMLERAMLAQRNGDIRKYSMLTAEAQAIHEKIQLLQQEEV